MESKERNNTIQNLLHKMRQTELNDSEWDRLRVLGSEDPFLMDAIEGLRLMTPNERTDRIKSIEDSLDELLGQKRKKKTITWQLRRVAAALILIFGFWAVWQAFPEGQSELAQHEPIVSDEQQDNKESQEPQRLQETHGAQESQESQESQERLKEAGQIEEASGMQRNLSTAADAKKSNDAAPTAELIHDKEVNSDLIAADIQESDYQESTTEVAKTENQVKELDPDISSVQYQVEGRSATRAAPLKAEQDPAGLSTPSAQRSADSGFAETQDADIRSIVYSNKEMDTSPTTINEGVNDGVSLAGLEPRLAGTANDDSSFRTIRGTVLDDSGEPLIGANIVVSGMTFGTVTNFDGVFQLSIPAEVDKTGTHKLIVSYTGYSPQETVLTAASLYDFVMQEGLELSEVVVYKSKMKQQKKNQAPDHISYALAIPQMGWKSYYKYIRKNILTPKAAKDASISGTVMLEFDLKQDGSPHNFRIVQSLGHGCDEEAIRLVREGPKWDVKNAQVEIGGLSVDF